MANISSPEGLASNLWYPGDFRLDDDYPTPTDNELVELWSDYRQASEPLSLQGVYGVYERPAGSVKAIASIDVCEVLRETAKSFHEVIGTEAKRTYEYTENTWIDSIERPPAYSRGLVTDVLRVLMNQGLVPPVPQSDDIAEILINWRQQGVYVLANTSTLPGCEPGTIRYSLGRDYPDCFDGIVFPRNHDGNSSITKAGALAILADEAGLPLFEVPILSIDDAPHHIQSFGALFPNSNLYIPRHDSNGGLDSNLYHNNPYDAFAAADQHLKDQGVIA